MDRLESMAAFLAAVEAGSLSGASRALGVPLATLSRRVSDLETHLHTRLLTRTSRRLTLTDAGQSYLASCKKILEDISEAERAATGEYSAPRGELTVAAPMVFGRLHALPIVTEFLRAYPDIDIRLQLSDRVANLADDHIDAALRIGELPDSSLVAARIGAIRRVVCASPAYFSARGRPLRPGDLNAYDCVTFEALTQAASWTFTVGKSTLAVAVHSRLAVTTAEAAVDAAVASLGITRVLCYQAASALRAGALSLALEDFEPPPSPVSIVYAAQPRMPVKLRAFLDFTVPRLKERVALAAV